VKGAITRRQKPRGLSITKNYKKFLFDKATRASCFKKKFRKKFTKGGRSETEKRNLKWTSADVNMTTRLYEWIRRATHKSGGGNTRDPRNKTRGGGGGQGETEREEARRRVMGRARGAGNGVKEGSGRRWGGEGGGEGGGRERGGG